MKDFLVLFREEDGRTTGQPADEMARHQLNWKSWLEAASQENKLTGGKPLTLRGNVILNSGTVIPGPHAVGKEIVGGYLLVRAQSLEEATELIKTCPVYESDGFAEVREIM